MNGYEQTDPIPMHLRQSGNRLVVVHLVGAGMSASWGYTIWREGCAEKGRCHWTWSAEDAAAEADRAVSKLEQEERP
jgi:hypothetical protein